MKNEPIVKVGVIGLRNKGKSFLLNKFLNKSLPKGYSIKTEGLSIKYPSESDLRNHRNYILLDSVGFEMPLLDYEKKLKKLNKEEALTQLEFIVKDKKLTEIFLQNFIISSSDMLCLVVGVLSYQEQKLLKRIEKTLKTMINTDKIFKKLIVIHNLESFVEKEQVEDYIDEYLKNSATFELQEYKYFWCIYNCYENKNTKYQNNKYFVETFDVGDEASFRVFHLIMANDFSNAGKYYNKFAIDFLKGILNSFSHIKSFPVIENIRESFIKFSKDAFEKEFNKEDVTIANDLTIKLNPEKKILFKNCFVKFSDIFKNGFEPNYLIYKDKEKINITFESSGTVKEIEPICKYGNDGCIMFSISGNKEFKIPEENEDVKIYQNSIKQGKFNFQIKLPIVKLQNPDEPDFEKGTTENGTGGIYTFSYKLSKKDYEKKVYY